MAKAKIPMTPAIRILKKSGIPFTLHPYAYEDKGGTRHAARELNVDEHQVIKTLIMENEAHQPVLVLMHGDREVSTKALARELNTKTISPCKPEVAHKHTGYYVGGISPLGTRKPLKGVFEASIQDLPSIYINAGRRGLLAQVSPLPLLQFMGAVPVHVSV